MSYKYDRDVRFKVARCLLCGCALGANASVSLDPDDPTKPICMACTVQDYRHPTHRLLFNGTMIPIRTGSEE